MEAFSSRNSTYKYGSVFTVFHGIQLGSSSGIPDDQSFDLAVIQFKDDGSFTDTDASQLKAATGCIENARKRYGTGAIVVIFIHGWHHDASWDIMTNDGDEHFKAFRRILMTLTLRELERYFHGRPGKRRVVGVYLSWNGYPENASLCRLPILTNLTFWNRFRTAKKIGGHKDIHTAVAEIVQHTKATLDDNKELPESPLVLIGHSMGALILESALLALLRDYPKSLIQPSQPDQNRLQPAITIYSEDQPVTFPELVLFLNSAAGSDVARDLIARLEKKKVRKFAKSGEIAFQPPLVISATSPRDWATRIVWRLANWPWRKTEGHNSLLRTHALVCTGEARRCPPKANDRAVSFGQAWHCLRRPCPQETDLPSFPIDLPKAVPLIETEQQAPQHMRYPAETT